MILTTLMALYTSAIVAGFVFFGLGITTVAGYWVYYKLFGGKRDD